MVLFSLVEEIVELTGSLATLIFAFERTQLCHFVETNLATGIQCQFSSVKRKKIIAKGSL